MGDGHNLGIDNGCLDNPRPWLSLMCLKTFSWLMLASLYRDACQIMSHSAFIPSWAGFLAADLLTACNHLMPPAGLKKCFYFSSLTSSLQSGLHMITNTGYVIK